MCRSDVCHMIPFSFLWDHNVSAANSSPPLKACFQVCIIQIISNSGGFYSHYVTVMVKERQSFSSLCPCDRDVSLQGRSCAVCDDG